MLRRIKGGEAQILTKEQERRLGESLQKALISDQPNPNREGCPHPKTLRDLAFHKRIGNPEVFERATTHMAECSACVRDALGYAEEYKEQRRRRRASRGALAIAAALAVAVAAWALWRLQQRPETEEIVQEIPAVRAPSTPATPGETKQQKREPEMAQYEPVTIELPSRWRGGAVAEPPIILSRGRLLVEIRFPIGSPEGTYKFRVLNEAGKVFKAVEATASTKDQITRLRFSLDTSDLPPGDYSLSVLEPGLDEWVDYALTVR